MSSAYHPVRRLGTVPARRRLALAVPAVLVSAALAVLAGCSSATGTAADQASSASSAAVGTAASGTHPTGAPEAGRPAAPVEIAIPSIGVTSPLMELGLNADETVEVPPAEKGMTAGWYTGGSVPGEAGAAVIIGHNDTRFGKAVFHDLKKIAKGAEITVTDDRGESARFTVTGTESVSKDSFPTEKVYGPTDEHALRLITCDGDFDAQGHPVNNLIVYATLD
ncbi:class F sortase [Streptomyces sp. MnatMP-M17]|uniref:class F sortase n=1 Tax=unclassified Streptomyces TaxID=2593676 RepID=UPI00081DBBBF|nr:class F sortase [Streptomyces sp. MnatMP-M17]MYZ37166.1 class F sortase [Streptomyces sp. SID4917]SCF89284.1 LPXTG-site transpeptidase (sortase) family protein [Streptomyces sp. MnatMP-M17]